MLGTFLFLFPTDLPLDHARIDPVPPRLRFFPRSSQSKPSYHASNDAAVLLLHPGVSGISGSGNTR